MNWSVTYIQEFNETISYRFDPFKSITPKASLEIVQKTADGQTSAVLTVGQCITMFFIFFYFFDPGKKQVQEEKIDKYCINDNPLFPNVFQEN